jgi:hypothetical protein
MNNTQKPALLKKLRSMEPQYIGRDGDPVVKMYSNRSKVNINGVEHRWPFIDILFFVENDARIWDKMKWMDQFKFKKTDMFPVHKRPFENLLVNAPRISLNILLRQYGMFNPSQCVTWHYSHRKETEDKTKIVLPCEELKDVYPFVHREYVTANNTMKETLKLGTKVIHTKYVDELESSRTPPYSLEPIK